MVQPGFQSLNEVVDDRPTDNRPAASNPLLPQVGDAHMPRALRTERPFGHGDRDHQLIGIRLAIVIGLAAHLLQDSRLVCGFIAACREELLNPVAIRFLPPLLVLAQQSCKPWRIHCQDTRKPHLRKEIIGSDPAIAAGQRLSSISSGRCTTTNSKQHTP